MLGNRFEKIEEGAMPAYIKLGNKAISGIYNSLYNGKIHDVLTGLFVMSRKAFESIRNVEPYRAGIAFFAIELANRGYKVADVPISYTKREAGKSKLSKSKLLYGVGVVVHIVRNSRGHLPFLIFGIAGILLIIAGFIFGVLALASFMSAGTTAAHGASSRHSCLL